MADTVQTPRPQSRWASPYLLISLVFFVLLTVFQASNGFLIIRRFVESDSERGLLSFVTRSFRLYAPFHLLFLALLLVRESSLMRVVQIVALMAYAVTTTLFVTPAEIGGDLVFVIAGALAYKYGYLERHPFPKIGVMTFVIAAVRVIVVAQGRVEPWRAINQAFIVAAALPIVYWMFEADLIKTRRANEKLEERLESDTPFTEFGRNVGGIVHDFRNDLSVFTAFGRIVKDTDASIDQAVLDEHEVALQRMKSRIGSVLFVTRSRTMDEVDAVRLREAVESVAYAVRADQTFRERVTVDAGGVGEHLVFLTKPLPLLTILESTLRNSLEAIVRMRETDAEATGLVEIAASSEAGEVVIEITDNGTGFVGEPTGNLLDQLAPGFTTKGGAAGFGLGSIRYAASRLEADVRIENVSPSGARTTVRFAATPSAS